MLVPLGIVVCTSNAIDYRITANRATPTSVLPVQTISIQQVVGNTGTITLRAANPETGVMTNLMVMTAPITGTQPVSLTYSVPTGMNSLGAESIYIRASVGGEGALCSAIQN